MSFQDLPEEYLKPESRVQVVHILDGGLAERDDRDGNPAPSLVYVWSPAARPDLQFEWAFRLSKSGKSKYHRFLAGLKKAGHSWKSILGKWCIFEDAESGSGQYAFTYPVLRSAHSSMEDAYTAAGFSIAPPATTIGDAELAQAAAVYTALGGNREQFAAAVQRMFPSWRSEDIEAAYLYCGALGE